MDDKPITKDPEIKNYFDSFARGVASDPEWAHTAEVSNFLRQVTNHITKDMSPDERFLTNVRAEYLLFQSMEHERHVKSIDEICDLMSGKERFDTLRASYLSMSQSRKSRAGYSVENHVIYELELFGLKFTSRQSCGDGTPDILLPGVTEYKDPNFPADYLMMLEVKRTTRERYKQVLDKQIGIRAKHRNLLLLEEVVYQTMLTDLAKGGLNIVVPKPLQKYYQKTKGLKMYSLLQFMEVAQTMQESSGKLYLEETA